MNDQVRDMPARYMANEQTAANALLNNLELWTGATRAKSGSGRGKGSNSKIELAGIKKLRELILELAVRGKLVPQNPDDEPASELLKRIEEEKARLVAEGKIKKPKKLALIRNEEKPFELPEGWEWVNLGELIIYMDAGWSPACPQEPSPADEIWGVLKTTSVQRMCYLQQENKRLPESKSPRPEYEVKKGDILITRAGPKNRVGVACLVTNTRPNLMISDKIIRFHAAAPQNCGEYLVTCLNAGFTAGYIEQAKSGMATSQMNISQGKLLLAPIALPPLAEQQRIVAKVDELMALCDQLEQQSENQLAAHQQLVETLLATLTDSRNAKELTANWQRLADHFDLLFSGSMGEWAVERLKESILQLAVMGKLVPQNPDDEPASELLQRIEAEKARLVVEGKIKKPKKLPPISDEEKPFELPEGWEWVRLIELGFDLGGGTPSKTNDEYWNGDIPWVSPKDMKQDVLSGAQDYVSSKALEKTSLKLVRPNSLLLVVRGMILDHSFPVALNFVPVTINQDMKALVFDGVSAPFMLKLMQGYKNHFVSLVERSSHGTCKLNSVKLWSSVIAIPPVEEQHRIVAKVDELFALCDQLKASLQAAGETQLNLTDALVDKALA